MRLVSINVGQIGELLDGDRHVPSGFRKAAVTGPVRLLADHLDGDVQADRRVHGGDWKAVYAYPSEHYPFWKAQLPDFDFAWGSFGENLTTEGLSERDVHPGDLLRIGSAELEITAPRQPCYKINLRFERSDMQRRFLVSGYSGFYLRVRRQGLLSAGDPISLLPGATGQPSISQLFRPDHAFDAE